MLKKIYYKYFIFWKYKIVFLYCFYLIMFLSVSCLIAYFGYKTGNLVAVIPLQMLWGWLIGYLLAGVC